MSESLLIRVECKFASVDTVLFEGRMKPKKHPSPRGIFDLWVGDMETPMGLPLELDVYYDAGSNAGRMEITTSGLRLMWMAALTRPPSFILLWPTQEELTTPARWVAEGPPRRRPRRVSPGPSSSAAVSPSAPGSPARASTQPPGWPPASPACGRAARPCPAGAAGCLGTTPGRRGPASAGGHPGPRGRHRRGAAGPLPSPIAGRRNRSR